MLKVKVSPKVIKPIQPSRFFSSQSKPLERQDVVVVGGGVGGYVAAIKASQLGLKTTCVEYRGALGGTCLNVGCIPSKSLLNSSHKYEELKHMHQVHGIKVDNFSVDLAQMMKMKDSRVKGLTSGVESLFLKYKVNYVRGKGKLTSPNQVAVELNNGGTQLIDTENIIIATGSEVASLPTIKIDEKKIISSTGALSLSEVPKKLIVIGGGIIGLELGSVWSRLGSEVTIVEFTGRIAAGADPEVATELQKILTKQGLKFQMNTKVSSAVYNDKGTVTVTMEDPKGGNQQTLEADVVLVSVGRKPYTEGLGLKEVGVKTSDKGFVLVNANFRTNIPSIRAIGDCIGGPMLAHKAEDEGVSVAEDLVSPGTAHIDYNTVPSVIYTWPEVSWVGQTEEELKKKNIPYKIGKFPFIGNSRARTNADAVGFVKFLADAQTDKLLGAHIIGPNAGELIHEAVLAIEYGASAEDIGRTSHAHPTLSEALKEAAMSTYDKPIHF